MGAIVVFSHIDKCCLISESRSMTTRPCVRMLTITLVEQDHCLVYVNLNFILITIFIIIQYLWAGEKQRIHYICSLTAFLWSTGINKVVLLKLHDVSVELVPLQGT